jgi:cystathionine beta-lyase/cystathionine gamma-synthase
MRQHQVNALALAQYLATDPHVTRVIYPGLGDHPQHGLAKRQMKGFGGMVTCYIKGGKTEVNKFAKALRIWNFAESLGGTESLVCHPETMSHAVLNDEQRAAAGIDSSMLRFSTGIEASEDLIEDVSAALRIAHS